MAGETTGVSGPPVRRWVLRFLGGVKRELMGVAHVLFPIPEDPWCWNIYLHWPQDVIFQIIPISRCQYSSTMDPSWEWPFWLPFWWYINSVRPYGSKRSRSRWIACWSRLYPNKNASWLEMFVFPCRSTIETATWQETKMVQKCSLVPWTKCHCYPLLIEVLTLKHEDIRWQNWINISWLVVKGHDTTWVKPGTMN